MSDGDVFQAPPEFHQEGPTTFDRCDRPSMEVFLLKLCVWPEWVEFRVVVEQQL